MLFQELGKMKRIWIMTSIIEIVLAVILIMCPVSYMGMLVSALGYILLVYAAVIMLNFISSKKVLFNYITLTGGLIIGLLGLFVLIQRREILPMLGLLFGVILVIGGLNDLLNAFVYARRAGRAAWWFLALLSLITIGLGVIILVNPWWDTPAVLKLAIGCMMLFAALVSIVRVILTWPFRNV